MTEIKSSNIFGSAGKKAELIGMIHIPINNILLGISNGDALPSMNVKDHKIWFAINNEFQKQSENISVPEFKSEFPGVLAISSHIGTINKLVKKLSFINYLEDRAAKEIELMHKHGFSFFQLENIGAPYSTRNEIPIIEQCVMEYITSFIKSLFPDIRLGIQVLSFADNVALEIAARHNLEYVRGESFMFSGLRPDTSNKISGTLKKAYLLRSFFNRELEKGNNNKPCIFVDIQKKHTFFTESLDDIEIWLDNIRFMKIEGIILSGKNTGSPIDIEDFIRTRDFVDKLKVNDDPIDIPIIAGSGASLKNINEYKKYCDAIIVGSYIKKSGNWEDTVDEQALKHFIDIYIS